MSEKKIRCTGEFSGSNEDMFRVNFKHGIWSMLFME